VVKNEGWAREGLTAVGSSVGAGVGEAVGSSVGDGVGYCHTVIVSRAMSDQVVREAK
jgi:hypothetical protein